MSGAAAPERPHLFREGGGRVLLMLHGTGGNEQQIAELAPLLDPEAAVLAPRGAVVEHGMLRWFHRHAEGVFDSDSVVAEAAGLAAFVDLAVAAHSLQDRELIAVGLSNGANIALATLLLHPRTIRRVVAFSGMHPLPDGPLPDRLDDTRVLLLNGAQDPMAPAASVDRLERDLRAAGTRVDRRVRPGGHGLERGEIDAAVVWIGSPPAA